MGRWWQIDPILKPSESPYVGMSNNPIAYWDGLGADTTNTLPPAEVTATREQAKKNPDLKEVVCESCGVRSLPGGTGGKKMKVLEDGTLDGGELPLAEVVAPGPVGIAKMVQFYDPTWWINQTYYNYYNENNLQSPYSYSQEEIEAGLRVQMGVAVTLLVPEYYLLRGIGAGYTALRFANFFGRSRGWLRGLRPLRRVVTFY